MVQILSITGKSLSDGTIQVIDKNGKIKRVASSTSTDNFEYTQGVPSAVWTITHNLHYHPSITVVDSSDRVVEGLVDYIDLDNIQVTFSGAFSGKAYLS